MAEGTKVRVVRCPRCENLLPEVLDYSVYRCGGCGAVLRANNQTSATDGLSEEERVRGNDDSAKLESSSQKSGVTLTDAASETGRESYGLERRRSREKSLPEKSFNSNTSTSLTLESREDTSDYNGERGVESLVFMFNHMGAEKEAGCDGGSRYTHPSKAPAEGDERINMNVDEFSRPRTDKEIGEVEAQTENANGLQGHRKAQDWRRSGERDGSLAFRRPPRAVVEGLRYSNSFYPEEGPSNYHLASSYGYAESIRNQGNEDGYKRVEYLEQDRAELLRKLDELKDQLNRSFDVLDKPKERHAVDRRMTHPDLYGGRDPWFPEGLAGSSRSSRQPFFPDNHIPRPSCFNHGHESVPLMSRLDVDLQNYYPPPMHAPNDIAGYRDPFGPPMLRRTPDQFPRQYDQRPSHDYFSGNHMDIDSDPMAVYPHNTFFHHPACSCLQCYNKHRKVPAQPAAAVSRNRRLSNAPIDPMSNQLETPSAFGPPGYTPKGADPPWHSLEPQFHTRRPRGPDLDMDDFGRAHSGGMVIANVTGHRCRPIAGGAPFITCYSCFALLQLPRRPSLVKTNQQKLRCGACSTIMSLAVENKRLVVSVSAQTTQILQISPDAENSSGEMVKGCSDSHNHVKLDGINSSEDYDSSGYNFQSMDTEQVFPSNDPTLDLNKSQKIHILHSSSSSSSEDMESHDSVIAQTDVSSSVELSLKASLTPPLPGSPLQEHFDFSSAGRAVSRFGKGNLSKRSDHEKVISNMDTFRQDSIQDASAATETEVSFNGYSNTGMSQDSGDVSGDLPRINKGGQSFFAGLIKKSFRDFSRSNQTAENDRSNVSVNGKPIPDHLVKKAEKKAGSIQAGQYWYDFNCGFWGVMGHPCLGIIPPFIEEFNIPMPKNCAGGNTGVFVNGRELHQKDLDLLVSRGLPNTAGKSYIIEISGRVLDEDSGEELKSLGKLAPTVQKAKHGFGMRVPRVLCK
ncbi:PREDICTED: uncharacterized protein LOC104603961 [Nelumbo nucifera]|uniref:Uncharacterized protein LOC104603961 n=2 Tax=Nelumbo nucifera TaxID=4432 RepID=A0A1U8AKF3_NELNU|nr:PREDICTED: uncharacterized protein LOC104603961 [Nelumbo nucifera]DAD36325.1 TPA_asm: hypothetical protein HUJ06_006966 [Nelumbo nucifera]